MPRPGVAVDDRAGCTPCGCLGNGDGRGMSEPVRVPDRPRTSTSGSAGPRPAVRPRDGTGSAGAAVGGPRWAPRRAPAPRCRCRDWGPRRSRPGSLGSRTGSSWSSMSGRIRVSTRSRVNSLGTARTTSESCIVTGCMPCNQPRVEASEDVQTFASLLYCRPGSMSPRHSCIFVHICGQPCGNLGWWPVVRSRSRSYDATTPG